MTGNPRRFKTYVANRVSSIVELIPSNRWNHVEGIENPADSWYLTFGIALSQALVGRSRMASLWHPAMAPQVRANQPSAEVEEICSHVLIVTDPIVPSDQFSSFTRLTRVTAW